MKKNDFGLEKISKSLTKNSDDFLKNIQEEIIQEEEDSLKDFIKGAYRLKVEKEKEVETLSREIELINQSIADASQGNWDRISNLKIPARFFNEATLRKHGKSLLEGSNEVRFIDLYVPDKGKR